MFYSNRKCYNDVINHNITEERIVSVNIGEDNRDNDCACELYVPKDKYLKKFEINVNSHKTGSFL